MKLFAIVFAAVVATSSASEPAAAPKMLRNEAASRELLGFSCQQVACHVRGPNVDCAKEAARIFANQIGNTGAINIESTGANDLWVRYMSAQVAPPRRGVAYTLQCTGGTAEVMNCQATGTFKCK